MFVIIGNIGLPTAEYSGADTTHGGKKSERARRIVKPVLIGLIGLGFLSSGFWLIYWRARTGGLRCWLLGAALFFLGYIFSVVGGIWSLVALHSPPLSFAETVIHAAGAPISAPLFAPCFSLSLRDNPWTVQQRCEADGRESE